MYEYCMQSLVFYCRGDSSGCVLPLDWPYIFLPAPSGWVGMWEGFLQRRARTRHPHPDPHPQTRSESATRTTCDSYHTPNRVVRYHSMGEAAAETEDTSAWSLGFCVEMYSVIIQYTIKLRWGTVPTSEDEEGAEKETKGKKTKKQKKKLKKRREDKKKINDGQQKTST